MKIFGPEIPLHRPILDTFKLGRVSSTGNRHPISTDPVPAPKPTPKPIPNPTLTYAPTLPKPSHNPNPNL